MSENAHTETNRNKAEKFLVRIFSMLLPVCQKYGITTKRAAELLTASHIKTLAESGSSQLEMIPVTGLSTKTLRRYARDGGGIDETDIVSRVIGDWKNDPEFPSVLTLDKKWPGFDDLCERYGREMSPSALLNLSLIHI